MTPLRYQVLVKYSGDPPRCLCPGCLETNPEVLEIDHVQGDGGQHRDESDLRGDLLIAWLADHPVLPGYQVLCRPCNRSKGNGESCRLGHTANGQGNHTDAVIPTRLLGKGGKTSQPVLTRRKVTFNLDVVNIEWLSAQPGHNQDVVNTLIREARLRHPEGRAEAPAVIEEVSVEEGEAEPQTHPWRNPSTWAITPPLSPVAIETRRGLVKRVLSFFFVALLLVGCTTAPNGQTGVRLPNCSFTVGGKYPSPTRCSMTGGTVVLPRGGW